MVAALFSLAVVIGVSQPASAAPFTFAYADGSTLSGLVSDSGPTSAGVFTFDIANAGYVTSADTHSEALYGSNTGKVGLFSSFLQPVPDAQPNPVEPWGMGVSYSLQVLSGSTWIDVVQSSIPDSAISFSHPVNEVLFGHFDFVAGVPYEIRSVLGTSASGGYAVSGSTLSIWDDLFTFSANAPADFGISLVGSLSATYDGRFLPIREDQGANIDFSAVLQTLHIPTGVAVEAASGTEYPVSVPEAPIRELLVCGLFALAVGKSVLLQSRASS